MIPGNRQIERNVVQRDALAFHPQVRVHARAEQLPRCPIIAALAGSEQGVRQFLSV